MFRRNSFTLIELLVVIGIVAILSVAVLLALNPTQLMAQGRDATRLNDLDTLQHALNLYQVEQSNFGSSTVVYVSVPDPGLSGNSTNTCTGLSLPVLPAGYSYQCVSPQNLQKTDGTGWIPVNFTQITSKPLSQLPLDPVNTTSSGNYYTYSTNGSQWELTAIAESQKYKSQTNSKTNFQPGLLAQGSNLTISPLFSPTGLVGYWPLDEGTGTVATDLSGKGFNGTWSGTGVGNNATYYSTGKIGLAGIFDGSTDQIALPSGLNSLALFNGTGGADGNETFSAWIKIARPSGISYDGIGLRIGGWDYLSVYSDASKNVIAMVRDVIGNVNVWPASNSQLQLNQWTHVTFVLQGGVGLRYYINGVLDATIPNSNVGISIYAPNPTIGNSDGGNKFYGMIDDVRVYNRALSSSEIQAIYNATK